MNIYTKAKKAGNAVAIISLEVIKENFKYLKKLASPAICMPVLKGNAYGLGAKEVATALLGEMQACFVATPSEGSALRDLSLKNHRKLDIFILHGFLPNESKKLAEFNLIPVINTLQQALEWHKLYTGKPCAVQLDSGMSRFGLSDLEIKHIVFRKLNIVLILSHLACAGDEFHPKNREQLIKFSEITTQLFPNIPKSIAASEGIFLGKEFHLDVVRTGISLYADIKEIGCHPIKNAVSIEAPVFQISKYGAGKYFGYNNTWMSERTTVSATIGMGYADCCLSSRKTNQNIFLWKDNISFPLIGRTSMDSVMIDITDHSEMIQIGDFVELLGNKQSLLSLAKNCEITPHEVLTSIGHRISKEYLPIYLA